MAHYCPSNPCPICYPQVAWPWQYPQVASYIASDTGPSREELEDRVARLERFVERLTRGD
jgi:hypothetical protein